jgi:hypothetical protein
VELGTALETQRTTRAKPAALPFDSPVGTKKPSVPNIEFLTGREDGTPVETAMRNHVLDRPVPVEQLKKAGAHVSVFENSWDETNPWGKKPAPRLHEEGA